jgi:membrane-associated protease RseP (regulator of RpoE activity)
MAARHDVENHAFFRLQTVAPAMPCGSGILPPESHTVRRTDSGVCEMHRAESGNDGTARSSRTALPWTFAPLLLTASSAAVGLADDLPRAAAPPAFQAGDISIGEPIALPVELPRVSPPQPAAAPRPRAAAVPAVPGSGWLGLVVAESATPGRFAVAEVAVGGPAAASGIVAGDEVRAIDGLPLRNSDEVAQALTAIAAGQQVRLAIGRAGQVADVTIEAIPRPLAARGWGAANPAPAATPPPPVQAQAQVQAQGPAQAAAAAPTDLLPPPRAATATAPAPAATVSSQPASTTSVPPLASNPLQPGPGGGQPPASAPSGDFRGRTALGVRTLPIDPNLQARFGLPEASGAYVIGVVGDLPASKAGVPPGSVIVALDDRPVRSPAELTRLVTSGPVGRPVSLEYVLPGGTARRAEVVLQTLERPLEQALLGGAEPAVTDPPALESAGTTVRRPVAPLDQPTAAAVRGEIRQLRIRLESLERRLESAGR